MVDELEVLAFTDTVEPEEVYVNVPQADNCSLSKIFEVRVPETAYELTLKLST